MGFKRSKIRVNEGILPDTVVRFSHSKEAVKTGIEIIAEERKRQIEKEGFTPERDAKLYQCGELSDAAACYATRGYWRNLLRNPGYGLMWPWNPEWWKPTPDDRINELAKAGALIAAEIDRLQRINP